MYALIWLILCMFDLYLITDSCIVQHFLKQLFSVICVKCGGIFFTSMIDCVLSITGTVFFWVDGGLIRY